jgi:transposase InsO family protein
MAGVTRAGLCCYTTVKPAVRDIRPVPNTPFEVRFETTPGEQAQADLARFEVEFSNEPGVTRIVWLISMVMGYSRLIWARFVVHQADHEARAGAQDPYLLRGMEIVRPNQVWTMDITYIPMARGFVYLAVVLDRLAVACCRGAAAMTVPSGLRICNWLWARGSGPHSRSGTSKKKNLRLAILRTDE